MSSEERKEKKEIVEMKAIRVLRQSKKEEEVMIRSDRDNDDEP